MLSIIMPAYNESKTIEANINKILANNFGANFELIVVNDGSDDSTEEIIEKFRSNPVVKILNQAQNRGKGSAVKAGANIASGSHILIFDADDEYDIRDIKKLLVPLNEGRCKIVYGVRVRGHGVLQPSLLHQLGNFTMTLSTNLLFGSAISDLHTCIKIVPKNLFISLNLEEEGFGLDTELTAKLLAKNERPFEMPISYVGRSKAEGKKITFKDALICFYILFKIKFFYRANLKKEKKNAH